MQTKRVVFIALETFSLLGGAQNFNRRLIRTLAAYAGQHSYAIPIVLILRDKSEDIPQIAGIRLIAAGSRLQIIWFLLRELVKGIDLLLVGQINLAPLALLARCIQPSLRTLLIVHGIEVWDAPQHRPKRLMDTISLIAIDRIASVSRYTANMMSTAYGIPTNQFCFLPNAIDITPQLSASRQRAGRPTILAVSRLGTGDEEKHLDKVIRGVALLKDKLPEIVCEIVGDGPLRSGLEQLARELDVANAVLFRGRLSDEEKEKAYNRAWAFVLPSSKEGFGIVYLEAWLHRLPVICSTKGAAPEVVTDGADGFVVDPDNISALADAMFRLLIDEDISRSFGENGLTKVLRHYSQSNFSKNLEAILDDALKVEKSTF
ncbi:glycosyltransferase family 4 protein [Bradyrhizobium sp. 62B]|uniref:glycosyltransferase family 4 protein n=1 Tax=Bradyrhizobium sp. 62B TaxID=2898442 RepID=UPI002557D76F|nr:glycosyltransferase family 4 protein [Bradyrhizobium sp. 62B]